MLLKKKSSNEFSDARFRLHHYMSHSHLTAILDSIKYTSNDPPSYYKDRFWEIQDDRGMECQYSENLCLEYVWATKRWLHWLILFLLAISEVNTNLAQAYFWKKSAPMP